ncbi:hypothetical protein EUGRSUZ_H00101 [Eucalyptus grandis]|uniref:Uncharacterized protein n=2 Tax=Eucalyptus grandis TaxID=71139 RepID=A0ACC3JL91_EUCGR|nr:hypothetical protein EUGRSUZ_H00101 [Eucalyptus grandis]
MTSPRITLLLLVLLTVTYASAGKLSGSTGEATVDEPIVSVVSALPNGTQAMQIRCERDGSTAAGCSWATREKAFYWCEVVSTRMFVAWHAFQPRRNAGWGRVLWLVREEGFFLSVNGTGWALKAVWETE